MDEFDLVVVGAGLAGLACAKTFHQLEPTKRLVILEAASSLGGTWAKHRLYSGLKSNNMLGTYEYPDFPMDEATFGLRPGEHIPGHVLHDYLTRYADRFDILDRIRYSCRVSAAEHRDGPEGGWILTTQDAAGAEATIVARKLVIATGLTSDPFLPEFRGQDEFGVPLFHNKHLPQHAAALESAKSVTVFGGTKSAWDAVYEYGSKGVHVDWVMRKSGHGPTWMAPPYVTPLKKWLEKLVHTRMLTWFSPCIWGSADGYTGIRGFYHGTVLGRAIVNAFWSVLGGDVVALNGYDKHPELAKLKPWSEAMYTASSFSILNYPTDFFDLVRRGTVSVHIADIERLSPGAVHLSDGTAFPTDAFVAVTGWKHAQTIRYLPEGMEKRLGIPTRVSAKTPEPVWTAEAVAKADAEILSRFPRLRDQPAQSPGETDLTPYHLYRFMAPVADERLLRTRDIAFAGTLMNFSVAPIAHAQALWIYAYQNDKLPARVLPPAAAMSREAGEARPEEEEEEEEEGEQKSVERVRYETVLHARFGRWRYPAGRGTRFPDFVFDAVPYIDQLLGDLGLRVHRKAGWLAEATEPYGPADYRDIVPEWLGVDSRKDR